MLITKITNASYTFIVAAVLLLTMLFVANPVSVGAQAGCGSEPGQIVAGTMCADGTFPLRDPALPLHCPGSSQQGPVDGSYTVSCPARPGRAACTYSASTGNCVDSSGDILYPIQSSSPNEPAAQLNDCASDNIQAGLDENDPNHCGILDYLVLFINVLSALVGVVVIISIIAGGIQYTSAGSDPQKVAAAKNRIRNAIVALVFFIFMYAFLNWLVPGGVLR